MADMRNFASLIGYLGRDAALRNYEVSDPETGAVQKRKCVELSLCTNSLSHPVFHQVVGYADHHVTHLSFMKKGEKLMVTGYIYYDESVKDGVKRTHPKIIIDTFEMMTKARNKPSEPARQKALAS